MSQIRLTVTIDRTECSHVTDQTDCHDRQIGLNAVMSQIRLTVMIDKTECSHVTDQTGCHDR